MSEQGGAKIGKSISEAAHLLLDRSEYLKDVTYLHLLSLDT